MSLYTSMFPSHSSAGLAAVDAAFCLVATVTARSLYVLGASFHSVGARYCLVLGLRSFDTPIHLDTPDRRADSPDDLISLVARWI